MAYNYFKSWILISDTPKKKTLQDGRPQRPQERRGTLL